MAPGAEVVIVNAPTILPGADVTTLTGAEINAAEASLDPAAFTAHSLAWLAFNGSLIVLAQGVLERPR
jgi:hypothetical protein